MTLTEAFGWTETADTKTNPPQKRAMPPLLMGDILHARNGVPVFVEEWLRLEKARDARRAAKLDPFAEQEPR